MRQGTAVESSITTMTTGGMRMIRNAAVAALTIVGLLAFAPQALAAPTNTVDPSFTGDVVNTNSTLTAVNGTWSGTGTITYTYEWQVSPNNFGPGITTVGTGSTYTIPVNTSYCDDYIRVSVTATDSTGSTTVSSGASQIDCPSSSAPSLDPNPGDYSGAELTGIRRVGETLTLAWGGSSGDWTYPSGGTDALTIQWQRNCGSGWSNFDPGAGDDLTYVLTITDIDCDIRVVLTATSTFTGPYVYTTTATTNLRGVIQRQYGNTYYVAQEQVSGDTGAAPDGHNDCLGSSSDVNAPNPAGASSNSGFEACAQPYQAVNEEDGGTNPNNETRILIGAGNFSGAYIDNSDDTDAEERMLIQGAGRGQTTLDDCGGNDAVLEIDEQQDAAPRSLNVTVKDMTIDGDAEACDGIAYRDATGLVQNVRFVDLNEFGVDVQTARPSVSYCILPERVRVYQSSFEDGSFDNAAVSFQTEYAGAEFDSGCAQLRGIVDASQFDADGQSSAGVGVASMGPVSPTVEYSSFTGLVAGVIYTDYTKQAEVTDSTFECATQGVGSFNQDPPDYQPPILSDEGEYAVPGQKGHLVVSGNTFGCATGINGDSIAVNLFSGDAEAVANTITDRTLGIAVGPVALPFGPDFILRPPTDSPVAASLRANSITETFAGVISTNNGYAESTDLDLVGNRIARNLYGLTNYYDNDFDPYNQGSYPPSSNLQTSPVDAKDNWWGCNDGPTVNPSEATLDDLTSFDQFCGKDRQLPVKGDIIVDGGLGEGQNVADPAESNVESDPYLVMSCDATPRTIFRADTGGTGGTSTVTADFSRNSDGQQRDVGFPPSEVTFGGNTLGTTYSPTNSETDQATYEASASLLAGAKLGTVSPTATLDYQDTGCGSVTVRQGPNDALLAKVTKSQQSAAKVPGNRTVALIKVSCPAQAYGDCEIRSLSATSKAPGSKSLKTQMLLDNPTVSAGTTVTLKGVIPKGVYKRLKRYDNGAEAKIKIKVDAPGGSVTSTKIRDIRRK